MYQMRAVLTTVGLNDLGSWQFGCQDTTLSEETTRFYAGCTVLALEALHANDNIYRDLKVRHGWCSLHSW